MTAPEPLLLDPLQTIVNIAWGKNSFVFLEIQQPTFAISGPTYTVGGAVEFGVVVNSNDAFPGTVIGGDFVLLPPGISSEEVLNTAFFTNLSKCDGFWFPPKFLSGPDGFIIVSSRGYINMARRDPTFSVTISITNNAHHLVSGAEARIFRPFPPPPVVLALSSEGTAAFPTNAMIKFDFTKDPPGIVGSVVGL
jgi:hypothetical protein